MPTINMDDFVADKGARGERILAGMTAYLVTNNSSFGPRRDAWIGATNEGVWIVERWGGTWSHWEFYDYDEISAFEYRNSWISVTVSFFGGGYKYSAKDPAAGPPDAFVDAVRQETAARRSKAKQSKSKSSDQQEILDAIGRLSELHDSGVLTSDEFATKKAELLDRL